MRIKKNLLKYVVAGLACVASGHILSQESFPGGFVENASTAPARAALSTSEINAILPQRGPFKFPSPYNTEAVRITNASDCGGQDCINYAGYAYWRNINNHAGEQSMLIFMGMDRNRGGRGPSLYEYNKHTEAVTDLGPLFPDNHRLSWATGEGWYFSASMPTKLYINDGPRITRFDVITEQTETIADVTERLGAGYYITQMHSSDNDQVHSATVRTTSNYQVQGCITFDAARSQFQYFPRTGDFDECQVDRSGEWLLIKENVDGINGEDNRIINLISGNERILLDRDGAGGHSDMGHGYMIAADNWAGEANTWKLWDLNAAVLEGTTVYHNKNWNIFAPAHISHTNARAGIAAQSQHACGSSVNRGTGTHANEIICFNLDSAGEVLVVAPVMTDLDAPGGGDDYSKLPKGNLDITGQYFFWTSNTGGSRLDAFIVKVPTQLINGSQTHTHVTDSVAVSPAPTTTTAVTVNEPVALIASGAMVPDAAFWQDVRNVQISGDDIRKVTGCDGCPDAGTGSLQQIMSGSGRIEFVATGTGKLLFAGLSTRMTGVPRNGNDIAFALRLQGGYAEVRESGAYRSDIRFSAGDHFSIAVAAGKVSYAKNGAVFYTSRTAAAYPLRAASSLYSMHSALDNLAITADEAPKINNVRLQKAGDQFVLSWQTDIPSEQIVQYGPDTSYAEQTPHVLELRTSHSVTLSNINPGSNYHLRILARDVRGHIAISGDMTFTRP